VVGYDGRLYMTDGPHTMTGLRVLSDGGGHLKVWAKVVGNSRDSNTAEECWAKMLANGQAWIGDGEKQPISYQQFRKQLGQKSATNPDGMQNNPYRSLVYFTRDIGYSKGANATDYTEFLWEDWFNKQIANNLVHPLSFYHTDASVYGAVDV
ncbi:ParB/Srx family N-terminal domain-containing protein, partial [Acinetobacter baumannii]|nr:ParB/Srx family N-terminal domain-containing protein [Acinetobacter baumannii]